MAMVEGSLTLTQLRYVLTAAECGSISKAADRLYISQPSLSNAIGEIERQLDCSLFKRNPRGISLTEDGMEFIGYARQVLQQMAMLEEKYSRDKRDVRKFSVSTQHYTFAAQAFSELMKKSGEDSYVFTLFEGTTQEIMDNVRDMRSELGIIYLSDYNNKVISKILKDEGLVFEHLFAATPYIFLSKKHPLANAGSVKLEALVDYPCVTFDQGVNNSFYMSEEIMSERYIKKRVIVTDRAAVANFLHGADAYTISTGINPSFLYGTDLVGLPLDVTEKIEVGIIHNRNIKTSKLAKMYIDELKKLTFSFTI